MQGKGLIINMLDVLVDMSEHCIHMEKPKEGAKCSNCALGWNYNIRNHGCFLVETVGNYNEFLDVLVLVCEENNIDYKDKLNKVAGIFVTDCE